MKYIGVINALQPVDFLDIQMPSKTGFCLAK
jgi:hypothetical protein